MGFFRVRVLGDGRPLADVRIYREVGPRWEPVGQTDAEGYQRWEIDPRILPVKLMFEPKSGFWPKHLGFREAEGEAEVHLSALPRSGPTSWWHDCIGAAAGRAGAGEGIRVGIADTGIGPCSCLAHLSAAGAWIEGSVSLGSDACADIASHGTHVAGLLAARACESGDYVGIAPGVTAVVARVFADDTGLAETDDVANAIEALARDHHVHLINLSLGGEEPADVEREAILDALDAGALVIAASGNTHGAVAYPAAYEEVIAVTALGKAGVGSELAKAGTYMAAGQPLQESEGFYPGDFSCYGPEVTCTAPGVELIATVPSSPGDPCAFAAMTGTSMAAPTATGALAILLSKDPEYLRMEACRERAEYAREVLRRSCRDLGFPRDLQGDGLPTVS